MVTDNNIPQEFVFINKMYFSRPDFQLKSLFDYCKEHSTVYGPCVVRHWTGSFYTISVDPTADYIKGAYLDIYMNNQWTLNSTQGPVLLTDFGLLVTGPWTPEGHCFGRAGLVSSPMCAGHSSDRLLIRGV